MTRLLELLLGRLPIGWLQLFHNKTRLAAAVAGVTFANVLVFVQLGFLGALLKSIKIPYDQMNADIMVSASDMNTLADSSPLPRQRMFEALTVNGVLSATPLYYAKLDWKQPDGSIRTLDVFGIDPTAKAFNNPDIEALQPLLTLNDVALFDRRTRNVPASIFASISQESPLIFETKGRTLKVVGTFAMGGGFTADGNMIISDQTFLSLFPQRHPGAPNHIFLKIKPDADINTVTEALRATLPEYDSIVRPVEQAVSKDQSFQTTQRPVGIVFGFGTIIGILVGVVIVYQVLATDVADHIKEYATFKAIGYQHRFFLSIIFEEAIILATMGFVPGVTLAITFYTVVGKVTGLPLAMTLGRAIAVFIGTNVMCGVSGAIAARRLARANPAELF